MRIISGEEDDPISSRTGARAGTPLGPGDPALEGVEEVEGAVDVLMGAAEHGDTLVEEGGEGLV